MFILRRRKVHSSFHTLGDLTVRHLSTITSYSTLTSIIKARIDFCYRETKELCHLSVPGFCKYSTEELHGPFKKTNEEPDRYLDDICEMSATSAQTPAHPGRLSRCLNGSLLQTSVEGTEEPGSLWTSPLNFFIAVLFPDPTFGKNSKRVVNGLINVT